MENAGSWRAYFARLRTAAFSRERERVRRVSMNPDSGPFTNHSNLINRPLHIRSMQQMMCPLTSWFPKISLIQLLNSRILMRFPDRIILIGPIQNTGSQSTDIHRIADIPRLLWLATAVDAAAWTAHDLDEVVGALARFYHL